MASYKEAQDIRKSVFKGINQYSPKESWKKAIDYCDQKMAEIRAVNWYWFHNWRMCKDILAKEFGEIFVWKEEITDEQDAEIQRQVDISIWN